MHRQLLVVAPLAVLSQGRKEKGQQGEQLLTVARDFMHKQVNGYKLVRYLNQVNQRLNKINFLQD